VWKIAVVFLAGGGAGTEKKPKRNIVLGVWTKNGSPEKEGKRGKAISSHFNNKKPFRGGLKLTGRKKERLKTNHPGGATLLTAKEKGSSEKRCGKKKG